MNCTNCGKELVEGAKFCLECGTKAAGPDDNLVLVCGNCEAIPRKGKKFCSKCGADVSATGVMKPREDSAKKQAQATAQKYAMNESPPVVNIPNNVQYQQQPKKKDSGVTVTIIMVILGILGIVFWQVVENFF